MSVTAFLARAMWARNDRRRNAATRHPDGVVCREDIPYGPEPKWGLLNVYFPQDAAGPLPTIVSVHGGGYVYGDKELYHHYCADLAARGFAVVSFNYRLAPRWRFPAPLEDTNAALAWLAGQSGAHHTDPSRVFLVGDSAGAQIASQYAVIATEPRYAALFPFRVPEVSIRAVGLNCGRYELATPPGSSMRGFLADYLGRGADRDDPRLRPLDYVTETFPPAHITTSHHDFLREHARPMYELLTKRGVEAELACYGTPEQRHIAHVFHVDIRTPEAKACNDAQCAFFRRFL